MDKLKILIAEDRKIDQELFKQGLPDNDYEKKVDDDGEEAVNTYNSWKPDIILLDLMMPVKSGYSVLQNIREWEKNSNKKTTIIVITSLSKKDDIVDCAKSGIQGYIIKPVKSTELSDMSLNCHRRFQNELNS